MIEHCVIAETHLPPVHAFVKRGVDIYRCPTCGCIMGDLAFVPDQYEASDYYTLAYGSREAVETEWGFRWRYILRKITAAQAGTKMLDVGAGNGYFVYLARHAFGFAAEGVEISDAEIKYAQEKFDVSLRKEAIQNLPSFYDVVTSFNVLEHVKEPQQLLQAMVDRLRDGGLIVVTTPNPACIHRRLRGLKKWGMIDPPHHINLFTRRALEQMLAKTGLNVLAYETLSTYIRFVRNIDTSGLLLRRSLFQLLKLFNLGADHLFVARKGSERS